MTAYLLALCLFANPEHSEWGSGSGLSYRCTGSQCEVKCPNVTMPFVTRSCSCDTYSHIEGVPPLHVPHSQGYLKEFEGPDFDLVVQCYEYSLQRDRFSKNYEKTREAQAIDLRSAAEANAEEQVLHASLVSASQARDQVTQRVTSVLDKMVANTAAFHIYLKTRTDAIRGLLNSRDAQALNDGLARILAAAPWDSTITNETRRTLESIGTLRSHLSAVDDTLSQHLNCSGNGRPAALRDEICSRRNETLRSQLGELLQRVKADHEELGGDLESLRCSLNLHNLVRRDAHLLIRRNLEAQLDAQIRSTGNAIGRDIAAALVSPQVVQTLVGQATSHRYEARVALFDENSPLRAQRSLALARHSLKQGSNKLDTMDLSPQFAAGFREFLAVEEVAIQALTDQVSGACSKYVSEYAGYRNKQLSAWVPQKSMSRQCDEILSYALYDAHPADLSSEHAYHLFMTECVPSEDR